MTAASRRPGRRPPRRPRPRMRRRGGLRQRRRRRPTRSRRGSPRRFAVASRRAAAAPASRARPAAAPARAGTRSAGWCAGGSDGGDAPGRDHPPRPREDRARPVALDEADRWTGGRAPLPRRRNDGPRDRSRSTHRPGPSAQPSAIRRGTPYERLRDWLAAPASRRRPAQPAARGRDCEAAGRTLRQDPDRAPHRNDRDPHRDPPTRAAGPSTGSSVSRPPGRTPPSATSCSSCTSPTGSAPGSRSALPTSTSSTFEPISRSRPPPVDENTIDRLARPAPRRLPGETNLGLAVVSPRLALEVRHRRVQGGPVSVDVHADGYLRPVEDDLRMSFSRIRSSSDQPMSSSNAFRRRGPKLFPGCTCSTTRRRLTAPLPMVLMNPTVDPGSPFLGPSVSLQRLGEFLEGQSLQLIPGG